MLKEFIKIAPEMKIKVNASNIVALKKWMKICTPAYVETDILNITHQFKRILQKQSYQDNGCYSECSEKNIKSD